MRAAEGQTGRVGFHLEDSGSEAPIEREIVLMVERSGQAAFLHNIARFEQPRIGEQIGMVHIPVPANTQSRGQIQPLGAYLAAAEGGTEGNALGLDVHFDVLEPRLEHSRFRTLRLLPKVQVLRPSLLRPARQPGASDPPCQEWES